MATKVKLRARVGSKLLKRVKGKYKITHLSLRRSMRGNLHDLLRTFDRGHAWELGSQNRWRWLKLGCWVTT